MSEHLVDPSAGIEFNRGRLLQFYRMRKERPVDPVYWDMWEERALREAIASAEAKLDAKDEHTVEAELDRLAQPARDLPGFEHAQREEYERHIRSTVDAKTAEHALRKTATGEFESDAVRQDFSGWRDGYKCAVVAALSERIKALCSELQKANRGYTCSHNPPCCSEVS